MVFERDPAPSVQVQESALMDIFLLTTGSSEWQKFLMGNLTKVSESVDVNGELINVNRIVVVSDDEDNNGGDDIDTDTTENDNGDDGEEEGGGQENIAQANSAKNAVDDNANDRLKALIPSVVAGVIVFLLTAICIACKRRRQVKKRIQHGADDDDDDDEQASLKGKRSQYDPHRNVESIHMEDGKTVVHIPGSGNRGGRYTPTSSTSGCNTPSYLNVRHSRESPLQAKDGDLLDAAAFGGNHMLLSKASSYETNDSLVGPNDVSMLLQSSSSSCTSGGGRRRGGTNSVGDADSGGYPASLGTQPTYSSVSEKQDATTNGFCGENPCG
jgi:hypothetical protein